MEVIWHDFNDPLKSISDIRWSSSLVIDCLISSVKIPYFGVYIPIFDVSFMNIFSVISPSMPHMFPMFDRKIYMLLVRNHGFPSTLLGNPHFSWQSIVKWIFHNFSIVLLYFFHFFHRHFSQQTRCRLDLGLEVPHPHQRFAPWSYWGPGSEAATITRMSGVRNRESKGFHGIFQGVSWRFC